MTDYFNISMSVRDINSISALGLAHIGDAVYEVMVRAYLCCHGGANSHRMHNAAVSYVAAPAQAKAVRKILDKLTDFETDIFKRGRNTRVNSVPSRSTVEEYHLATGLEALFGALYLKGETERLNELFDIIMTPEVTTDAT